MTATLPPQASANTASPVNRPFRILVADDDRGNREALADLLHARGFDTVQAADGGEAVEIVRVTNVHLVFFDLHMPRLTGLEALQVVRQMNELLPAILMTADATREVMRQALAERVHTVLPKPVSPNLALHAIAQALTKAYGQIVSPPAPAKNPMAGEPSPTVPPPAQGTGAAPLAPTVTRQLSIQARITITRNPNSESTK